MIFVLMNVVQFVEICLFLEHFVVLEMYFSTFSINLHSLFVMGLKKYGNLKLRHRQTNLHSSKIKS